MASLIKREKTYYLQYYASGKQKRRSLRTTNLQVAKEKLRQFESAEFRGADNPLPTRTPIADVLTRYVKAIRGYKTPKSAQTEVYYLREAFGPICPAVAINSRRPSHKARKRPAKPGQHRRVAEMTIEVPSFEQITTAQVSEFISARVRSRGLSPKTANHFRQILTRLFNWATTEGGLKLPGDQNPAAKVRRYREHAPQIRFLTLPQIGEQLAALENFSQLHAMVAMYVYAGLRREEALWLQVEDVQLRAGHSGMIRIRAKTVGEDHWQPKTKSNRAVPVSRALRDVLLSYHPRPSNGGWYFPSPQGERYDPDNFSRDLRAAQEAAGLRWTCLDFRHTFGSQLAQKGESLYKISTLMGNSPEICRRHYAALLPENMADTVEFMSARPTLPRKEA